LSRPLQPAEIARAFHEACLAELDALKPGNVHRFGGGHSMSVADFEASAAAAAPKLAQAGIGVGTRILLAVEATMAAVGQNTNLGIILLSAPLAAAALDGNKGDLQSRLVRALASLSVDDAIEAYRAIRHARPGGLRRAPRHDVTFDPDITLLEAMGVAEAEDRIAWNYTHGFVDIFALGLPSLEHGLERWNERPWAVTSVYLGFLAAYPDTLIQRKFGGAAAERVRAEARAMQRRFLESATPGQLATELMDFDRALKAGGLNPGTSADLTVATLFADALQVMEKSH
jgi:triphosphoribosyl-dephospho-CoA synthase